MVREMVRDCRHGPGDGQRLSPWSGRWSETVAMVREMGLRAQEQGSTEHIKVQVKNNTLGLGACNNYEDKWIAHQDDFNQLLAELNNCHGTASSGLRSLTTNDSFSCQLKCKLVN
ncbi:PIN2/TERF1-interacting telomerase inhibitor 1-like [Aquarana catesbeiana]|uniref:PIN2/TERF1-interacting telomerase inhibitor 1-like n=1 Tax=Aquarana catesbeiana TaxID=8400 RepID=UPI003CC9C51F